MIRAARSRGQATLELMLALVIGLLVVVVSIKVWLFFAHVIVKQQHCYQNSRRRAGRNDNPGLVLYHPYGWGSAPEYGNPFWTAKPRFRIFEPHDFPIQSCPGW